LRPDTRAVFDKLHAQMSEAVDATKSTARLRP